MLKLDDQVQREVEMRHRSVDIESDDGKIQGL